MSNRKTATGKLLLREHELSKKELLVFFPTFIRLAQGKPLSKFLEKVYESLRKRTLREGKTSQ